MFYLKRADYKGNYHGFKLKPGFYYGTDTETNQYIATSGWECDGNVAIYFLTKGKWEMDWVSIEDNTFVVENLPEVNTKGKLSFVRWLEEVQGIDWNDYDENYSDNSVKEMETEYSYYLYDGLPLFVQQYLKSKEIIL